MTQSSLLPKLLPNFLKSLEVKIQMKTPIMSLLLLTVPLVSAQAASFTLTDNNSEVRVDDRNGITVWFVDGSPDNVFLSNYYYRIGPTGNESPFFDGLGTPTVTQQTGNQLELTYTGTELQAVVNYELLGGDLGSSRSFIDKSVTLTNLSQQNLDFHLFDYSDFDIKFNQLDQRDQSIALDFGTIVQNSATKPLSILTQVSPTSSHYEIADFLTLYNKFFIDQDGATTLPDNPPLNVPFPIPPSDNAFAFQWDFNLNTGESVTFNSQFDYAPVPEPLTILGAGTAIALGAGFKRKLGKVKKK